MESLSAVSVISYCFFKVFIFYQQLHLKEFRGESKAFETVLTLSAALGMLTGLAYLITYGWRVVWWAPIVIFVIGMLAAFGGFLAERFIGKLTISLAAFLGWPVAAYFMFAYIPA